MSAGEPKRADYQDILAPFPHPADSLLLAPIYFRIRTALPVEAKEIIIEVYEALIRRVDAYWGPPDVWHNLAISASRLNMIDEEYQFYISGLAAWPKNVDLLCDLLTEYTGVGNQHYSPHLARETWRILESLPPEETTPHWRFWVLSAVYFARIEGNPKRGIQQLDEGLLHVRRDGLMDLLRSYRTLLIDQAPVNPIDQFGGLDDAQQRIFVTLEQRYILGIRLGVENGYVLALELARLYQERAGARAVDSVLLDPRGAQEAVNDELDKALTYLKLAESMFTGEFNRPIDDIYTSRARILMVQGYYAEALRLLQAIPGVTESNHSMKTMLRLATLAMGGKLDDDVSDERSPDTGDSGDSGGSAGAVSEALERLFDGDGTALAALARKSARVQATLYRALRILQNAQEQ